MRCRGRGVAGVRVCVCVRAPGLATRRPFKPARFPPAVPGCRLSRKDHGPQRRRRHWPPVGAGERVTPPPCRQLPAGPALASWCRGASAPPTRRAPPPPPQVYRAAQSPSPPLPSPHMQRRTCPDSLRRSCWARSSAPLTTNSCTPLPAAELKSPQTRQGAGGSGCSCCWGVGGGGAAPALPWPPLLCTPAVAASSAACSNSVRT